MLCIHDPEAYNEIYVTESKRKTENYQAFSQGIGFDGQPLNVSLAQHTDLAQDRTS